jgi:hypothetical protein
MITVAHVRTNAKLGADVDIGPKTIIVGRNGTGKSTIINGIELALTGRCSDIGGKDVSVLGDLLALAPKRAGRLFAELVLSDDQRVTFQMHGENGRGSLDEHTVPGVMRHPGVLPIRTFDEHFSSVERARAYLTGIAEFKVADVLALLPAQVRSLYEQTVKSVGTGDAPADLRAVIMVARDRKKEAKGAAKAAENAAEASTATPVSEGEITKANKDLDRARKALADLREAQALNAKRATYRTMVDDAPDEDQDADEIRGKHERAHALTLLLDRASELDLETCPLCAQSVHEAEDWSARAARIAKQVAKLPPIPDDEVARKVQAARDWLDAHGWEDSVAKPGETLEIKQGAVKSAEAFLSALQVRQQAWEATQSRKTEEYGHTQDAQTWTTLESYCTEAATLLVKRSLGAFVVHVQEFLPVTDTFDLQLGEGSRDVVRYGLVRDGVLHTALSGAEWARVTCAIACAIARSSPAIVIPGERAFDPATLREVMIALTDAPCQIILHSPVGFAGRLPKGWTLVRTEGSAEPAPNASEVEDAASEVGRFMSQIEGVLESRGATATRGAPELAEQDDDSEEIPLL